MGPTPSIRVVVVANRPVVRSGLAAMLDHNDDITVVGTADNPTRAHTLYADLDVDVVVINAAALDIDSVTATARWFERPPGTKLVILTDAVDEALAATVAASGVSSCLRLTTVTDHELADAVRGVMHGQATFSSEFVPELVRHDHRDHTWGPNQLTAREQDVLELLAQGHTNESIAHTLGLTTGTIRMYVSMILVKLGAPNRTAAAVHAINTGLVNPPGRTTQIP